MTMRMITPSTIASKYNDNDTKTPSMNMTIMMMNPTMIDLNSQKSMF